MCQQDGWIQSVCRLCKRAVIHQILISYEYLPVQQGTNLCNRVKVMSRSRRGNGNSGEAALAKLSQGVVAGLTRLVEDNADTVAAMLQAGECNDLELVQVL